MYGKLIDGKLYYAPINYLADNKEFIFNFNKNVELMKQHGFKEIIDNAPQFDPNTQEIQELRYEESENTIIKIYKLGNRIFSQEEQVEYQKTLALKMIATTLTDEQALQVSLLFDEFNGRGVSYKIGDRILYEGVLYKVINEHVSQEEWTPINAPSLFAKVINESIDNSIPDWTRPDSTNSYSIGNKVIFNGAVYESVIDNNVWSPTEYPSGWKNIS